MALQSRQRTPNPHLGSYYGIVASAFVSLTILLAMAEQLGWRDGSIARLMILMPLVLYMAIAVAARTLNVEDFFVSGRRVPQVYNAFLLAAITVGGTGLFAYTGALFFIGFDGLAIGLGWTCGLLLAAILFVPYLRRAGAYTLPAFLGQRFRSQRTRMLASGLQIAPTILLLAAEVKIAAMVLAMFLPTAYWISVLIVVVFVAATGILGGMRALTWSGSAEFIAGGLGLAIPLTVVAVVLTNLPVPQFTYGELLESLSNAETATGVTAIAPGMLAGFPGQEPLAAVKPFLQAFGTISEAGFFTLFICFMIGTAALPTLLSRSGVTASVADQRRSTAWALLLVALFAMTAPALVVFAKVLMFGDIAIIPTQGLPAWISGLSQLQILRPSDLNGAGTIGVSDLLVARDGIVLALPSLAALPHILTPLIAAAGLAVALAAAGSHLFTVGASLADDLYRSIDPQPVVLPRLLVAWAGIGLIALLMAVYLFFADVDALSYAVTAFAFAGATFFPVLLLAIWWPRCTVWGALASLATGFAVMFLAMTLGGLFGIAESAAGTAGASLAAAVLAFAAGVGASLYGPPPTKADTDFYEAMRRPDGETLYDQAEARAAAAQRKKT
ncbi:MAG: sodium:solute symporter [Methyloceanibacter sp.]|nr:MAG: sodium:solute symporter [Methyloceanibacter sp.]